MPQRDRHRSIALHGLLCALCAPFLWAWLLTRLWLPLGGTGAGGALPALTALLILLILLPAAYAQAGERFLLPWGMSWRTAAVGALGFALGVLFDLSGELTGWVSPLPALDRLHFWLWCRVGNGILAAVLLLALLKGLRELKGVGRVPLKTVAALAVALNITTALYVLTSRTVYVWDVAGYWSVARSLAQSPLSYSGLLDVWRTTTTLDYNHLLALPIALLMKVFGGSRAVFLFAISNLYTLPALWGLSALARDRKGSPLVLAGLFPMLTYIGLIGFVDVAAAALGIWAYVVYTSDRPATARGVVTGALLVGSFLLRRYFFFFAASFGVAALLQKLLFDRKRWADFVSLFFSCGFFAVTLTYSFLLEKVLGANYGDIYSAYKSPLVVDLLAFCRYFGAAFLAALLGLALCKILKGEDRPTLVLPLLQLAVCFAAFVAIQSHGQQHLLLYLPGLALLAVTALSDLPRKGVAALAALITVNCFIPKAQPATAATEGFPDLLPSFHFYGPQREDIDQLLALEDFVNSLSTPEAPTTAVVLASSFTFNSETLTNLRPSLNLPEPTLETVIQYHGTVDKRDAFNWNTATAHYLIVADPVQVHLGEDNQQVMALLAHHVLEGTGPGAAYEALPQTFRLSGGVTVRIFEQTRPWTAEDYHTISDALQTLYPDHAELYQVPGWIQ